MSLFCDETLRLTLTPTPPGRSSARNDTRGEEDRRLGLQEQDDSFDINNPELIEQQRLVEEQILQTKKDEEFAKQLQEEEERRMKG